MEFYSSREKNEIFLFAGKWIELEHIIVKLGRFKKPKATCFLSHVKYRPNTNTSDIIYT
jgi:hypothetical protein